MNRDNLNIRIAGFTLAVILGVAALGFIPPFKLFGMNMERVDILSALRNSDASHDLVEDYTADFDLLEQELAEAEAQICEVDTLPEPIPVR